MMSSVIEAPSEAKELTESSEAEEKVHQIFALIKQRAETERDDKSLKAISDLTPHTNLNLGVCLRFDDTQQFSGVQLLLTFATTFADIEVAKLLIQFGANINKSVLTSDLPLRRAVIFGNALEDAGEKERFTECYNIIKLLLANNANPEEISKTDKLTARADDELGLIGRALVDIENEKNTNQQKLAGELLVLGLFGGDHRAIPPIIASYAIDFSDRLELAKR